MVGYWRHVPHWLQAVASPIDSPYLSAALFNTGVQALLLGLLAAYARLLLPRLGWAGGWLAALLTPLFQLISFAGQMSIISRSPTYTFFYAWPLALLLLWLLPFGRAARRGQPLRLPALLLLVVLNGQLCAAPTAEGRLWHRNDNNLCKRASPARLAQAPEPVVRLPADCTVLA